MSVIERNCSGDRTQWRGFLTQLCAVGIALAVALGASATASAASSYQEPTPQEIAGLPEYCKYTQLIRDLPGGGGSADAHREHWTQVMGSTFSAMHHHCWGLVAVRRAATQRLTKQDRDHLISNSVNEFTYVINSAGKSFVLLPEVFTRRAQSQLLIGREREAIEDFKQAWSLKPDYWPAYAYLADYFIARKNYKSAREVLDLGLKEAPGSKALAERRSKLPREQEAAAEKNPTASPR